MATFSVLLLRAEDGAALLQRSDEGTLDVTCSGALHHKSDAATKARTAASALLAEVGAPAAVDLELSFATVLEVPGATPPAFEWVFFAELPATMAAGVAAADQVEVVASAALADLAYTERCTPRLARIAQAFSPVAPSLRRAKKRTVPPIDMSLEELRDYHLLAPCYYVFDQPGKGVRSKSVRALSSLFGIDAGDLKSLMQCIDRYHELSLIIDDIEDRSLLRRDRDCAHLLFGVPLTLNSAYFLTFKLLDNVPRLFRRYHAETVQLIVDGTVKAHRGQGLEIYWRDNHICPTEEEYIQMVRGKTSTPFVLAAKLFFLHADDIRLSAARMAQPWFNRAASLLSAVVGEGVASMLRIEGIEDKVIRLFDLTGIFFQVRDDYINLVDPEYWRKKGFCDDIHERKFSYPIIHMVRQRMGGYQDILKLYKSTEELTDADLDKALAIILQTETLEDTYKYLTALETRLHALATELYFQPFCDILDRLKVEAPTGATREALQEPVKYAKPSNMAADEPVLDQTDEISDVSVEVITAKAKPRTVGPANGHLPGTRVNSHGNNTRYS